MDFHPFEKGSQKNLPEHLEAGDFADRTDCILAGMALKEESKENKKQEQRICTYFIEK